MQSVNGYSLKEVAQKVGVVNATITRWIDTDKVDIVKKKNTQGHYFFTEADLDKLIKYRNGLIIIDKPKKPARKKPRGKKIK